ncbi:hypothetical protein FQN60_009190 [Etheostoma spectabile]|uniref:Uncharacterized protein n=1 Tax=Etheostoma spectabile TaxID=54343 RepID=A0A5J5CCV5_9PERO|nr:hypothetical protein FQN60_009190 [Etheostoma spectabile]
MQTVWETKRKHTACFQDVPGWTSILRKARSPREGWSCTFIDVLAAPHP